MPARIRPVRHVAPTRVRRRGCPDGARSLRGLSRGARRSGGASSSSPANGITRGAPCIQNIAPMPSETTQIEAKNASNWDGVSEQFRLRSHSADHSRPDPSSAALICPKRKAPPACRRGIDACEKVADICCGPGGRGRRDRRVSGRPTGGEGAKAGPDSAAGRRHPCARRDLSDEPPPRPSSLAHRCRSARRVRTRARMSSSETVVGPGDTRGGALNACP